MIRISGLKKAFPGRPVLEGIDATVSAGQIVTLLGPSGSGKSTLLRCLNGLERFDAGKIEIAGLELGIGRNSPQLLCRLRAQVGMVFQDFQLFPHLTVLENLTLAPRVVRAEAETAAEQRALELLAAVGLADRADARPNQLSGGQKQRVAIARALCQNVRVLLLDEPTSALDPELREEVREVLRRLARGPTTTPLTLLLVTHEVRLACQLADELWILNRGRIVERGPPARLLDSPESEFVAQFLKSASAEAGR
jgi:ABC-type polar amino acid transport system ATPase subunit